MTSLQMTPPVPTSSLHKTAPNTRTVERAARSGLGINVLAAVALAAAILLVFIAFAGDAAATGPVGAAPVESTPVDTIEIYVVQPGDTLWSIADGLASPGEDVRPLVDALNDIAGGASLEIGDRLVIDHAQLRD